MTFQKTFSALVVCVLLISSFAQTASFTHTVNGSAGSRLPEAASAILSANSGTHIVEFESYANVGTFLIEGSNADTILFRRKAASTQPLGFITPALFTFKSCKGSVIFKGLAFRADVKNGILIVGSELGKENQNLILDSCQIFSPDSLTTANIITWLANPNSKVTIRKSIISTRYGQTGMSLSSDTVSLDHDVINSSMIVTANITKFLELKSNTFIRSQVMSVGQPPGSSINNLSINNNLFLSPSGSRAAGLNLLLQGNVVVDSIKNNGNDPLYSKFDQGTYNASFSSGNGNSTFTGSKPDSSEPWNWDLAGETTRGAFTPRGASSSLNYNVYPGVTLLSKRLQGKDSVEVSIDSAPVPRFLDLSYDLSTPYTASMDSVRIVWTKDSAISFSGPGIVQSLRLPQITPVGTSILFSRLGSAYLPGAPGSEGSLSFVNGTSSASAFVPAFGSQNVKKGTSISVSGFGVDTSVFISQVMRTGRLVLSRPTLSVVNKRWRLILRGGNPFGLMTTSNAEGTGEERYGLAKANSDIPFSVDSLAWWFGGNAFSNVTDSISKYWVKAPYANSNQMILIEKLAIGRGGDTLTLPQGRILAYSKKGHQFKVDSTFQPTQSQFSNMGSFSRGLSFQWPGRDTGDTVFLDFHKLDSKQKAFFVNGNNAVAISPVQEDSNTIRIALGVGDSGKVVFLARKYTVPAGVAFSMVLGKDSVAGLISSTPGEYRLDTALSTTGLALDTFRVWTKRSVQVENLALQSTYTAWLDAPPAIKPERVMAWVQSAGKWDSIGVIRDGSRYRLTLPPLATGMLVAEKLESKDTLPIYPTAKPSVVVQGNSVSFKPVLSTDEKVRLQVFRVDVVFLDASGQLNRKSFNTSSPDTAISVSIPLGSLLIYKAGYEAVSGKVSWDSAFSQVAVDDKAFRDAVNSTSDSIASKVWDLIGFPQTASLSRVLNPLGSHASEAVAKSWNGKWTTLSSNTTLIKGRAILLGVTEALKPSLDPTQGISISPDTLSLDTGWQLVSDPLPVPVSDATIGLDSSEVSFFYTISWQGSGKDAKYNWVIADTLKPFKGYAVYSSKPTKLIFNPFTNIPPLQKVAVTNRLALTFSSSNLGERAVLYSRPGTVGRLSNGLEFLQPDFHAAWFHPGGPIMQGDSIGGNFLVHSPSGGSVQMIPNRVSLEGKVFAVWDPRQQKIFSSAGSLSLETETGWNAYRLLEADPTKLSQIESQLRENVISNFEILSMTAPHGDQRVHLSFRVPAQYGIASEIKIQAMDIRGREWGNEVAGPFMPGIQSLEFSRKGWGQGLLFVRFILKAGNNQQILSLPLFNQGGAQ